MTKDDANNVFIRYWQLFAVIITFAAGYGSMTSNIAAMAEDIQEQKTHDTALQDEAEDDKEDRQAVKLSVVAIEKDIEFIKENQAKQDTKLDKILDKLDEDD